MRYEEGAAAADAMFHRDFTQHITLGSGGKAGNRDQQNKKAKVHHPNLSSGIIDPTHAQSYTMIHGAPVRLSCPNTKKETKKKPLQ